MSSRRILLFSQTTTLPENKKWLSTAQQQIYSLILQNNKQPKQTMLSI